MPRSEQPRCDICECYADIQLCYSELAKFHQNSETRSFATYLISGELFPQAREQPHGSTQTDDGMDVDAEGAAPDASDEEEENVPQTTMTLVGEKDIEREFPFFMYIHPATYDDVLQRPNRDMPAYSPLTYTV